MLLLANQIADIFRANDKRMLIQWEMKMHWLKKKINLN